MTRRVDLVVFDLGGVLVQADRELGDAVRWAGYSVSREWLKAFEERLRGLPRRSVGAITSEAFYPLFAAASEGVFTVEDARRISLVSFVAEYPGIERVFDALEGSGVETAALSNVNDLEWSRLFPEPPAAPQFPTLQRLGHRFASHLMRAAKPDPRVYREVERETGYSGDRILFFDDREENVEAARLAGWTAELIDYMDDTAEQLLAWLRVHGVTG